MNRALLLCLTMLWTLPATAYELSPEEVAPGVWVFEGRQEHFTRENQGDIANTGFIVTGAGVIVIDTGPSARYGRAMHAAIRDVTREPVIAVYITHAHPDHFLGNQAFPEVPIVALPATIEAIKRDGDALTDNLYRMVGAAMEGTDPVVPGHEAIPNRYKVGDRELKFIAAAGHSGKVASDLMILDRTAGVLFAGDVVFHDRAPTTPHADVSAWIAQLDALSELDFRVLVPGHGPVARNHDPIEQTRTYLRWLDAHLREAADAGVHIVELMNQPLPDRFAALAVAREEYKRSVAHLYPPLEQARLQPLERP
ncbi:MAG: quinoprotein relay system zinc metallohydrolase 1 [Ectothiorhodospiraceae bacterium]|nr:quinoprotein relay system zinc metallohydrolase 1 [Ectothiorhodospiraceae bacterium]